MISFDAVLVGLVLAFAATTFMFRNLHRRPRRRARRHVPQHRRQGFARQVVYALARLPQRASRPTSDVNAH